MPGHASALVPIRQLGFPPATPASFFNLSQPHSRSANHQPGQWQLHSAPRSWTSAAMCPPLYSGTTSSARPLPSMSRNGMPPASPPRSNPFSPRQTVANTNQTSPALCDPQYNAAAASARPGPAPAGQHARLHPPDADHEPVCCERAFEGRFPGFQVDKGISFSCSSGISSRDANECL